MSNYITYALKLDKKQSKELKEMAKQNDRTLSGEIRHALKLHAIKKPKLESR
tara:strand:+ start:905 stop:1060 length:156 start_codon:yes stop_codon:yes gene_type:complete